MTKRGAGTGKKTRRCARLEGAEAILTPIRFGPFAALDKIRPAKAYRPSALDERIRASRTRVEARLLSKAKEAGVPCPQVLAVGPFDIVMSKMEGRTLNQMEVGAVPAKVWRQAGEYLARLHAAGIVHGDYTPANLMREEKNGALFVIDFGLGSISSDEEDYAVDALTMKKALSGKREREAFLAGYRASGSARVLALVAQVERRARYQDRGG